MGLAPGSPDYRPKGFVAFPKRQAQQASSLELPSPERVDRVAVQPPKHIALTDKRVNPDGVVAKDGEAGKKKRVSGRLTRDYEGVRTPLLHSPPP